MLSQYSWAQPSARRPPAARGGSVITEPRGARRPPARKHAAGPGTGKSGGEPQRPQPRHAPALEPPQAARLPPRLSQGPAVSSPPRTSHSESIAGPALGTGPASGPWGFRHHGTSRRQTSTSAQARRRAGNGEERGRTPAPATPPRSRSRAPTSRTASSPPQPGARGLVAPQNIPQRKHCGPSPRHGARQRHVGVPSSWNSRRQTPTGAQARHRAGNGEERGRTPLLTRRSAHCRLPSHLCSVYIFSHLCSVYILLINLWISSISCLFFLPLTGNFGPSPRAVKPARFFVVGPAKKVKGLSNQYRHCFQFLRGAISPLAK